MTPKTYIGDSVYAQFDGFLWTLTTEQGDGIASNTVHLEPQVLEAFLRLVASEKKKNQEREAAE